VAQLFSLDGSERVMILYRPSRRSNAGLTIFDLLVAIAACLVAVWVSGYFHGGKRVVVFLACYLLFTAGLWSFIFLWLLPLIRRHRQGKLGREK
jgi:hypothetical protein